MCAAGFGGVWVAGGGGCTSCVAGKFKSAAGDAACADCPAGQISAAAGAITCHHCLVDEYTEAAGQTACISCGNGETTNTLTGQTACSKKSASLLFHLIYFRSFMHVCLYSILFHHWPHTFFRGFGIWLQISEECFWCQSTFILYYMCSQCSLLHFSLLQPDPITSISLCWDMDWIDEVCGRPLCWSQ